MKLPQRMDKTVFKHHTACLWRAHQLTSPGSLASRSERLYPTFSYAQHDANDLPVVSRSDEPGVVSVLDAGDSLVGSLTRSLWWIGLGWTSLGGRWCVGTRTPTGSRTIRDSAAFDSMGVLLGNWS